MMSDLERKANKLKPLIKIQSSKLEQEHKALSLITVLKQELSQKLADQQQVYMKSLDINNEARSTCQTGQLASYEIGVESAKHKWFKIYEKLVQAQKLEKEQMAKLAEEQKKLKALENLKNKITDDINMMKNRREQKSQDELASRRFQRG